MSAYVNSKEHIDAILRVALDGPADRGPRYPGDGWRFGSYYHNGSRRDVRHEEAERLGVLLVTENARSVRYRYPDDGLDTLPGPIDNGFVTDAFLGKYQYGAYGTGPVIIAAGPRHLTAVEALKALDGYEYQSCEHPGWRESEAHSFCADLRHALISALPGYNEADTWEV